MKMVPLAELVPEHRSVKQCRSLLRRSKYETKDHRWVFSPRIAPKVEKFLSR